MQKMVFTPTFLWNFDFFHGHFFFTSIFFVFFMGKKNRFHGHKKNVFNLTGKKIEFFHGHRFGYHRWIFWKYSRENIHRNFWGFFWLLHDHIFCYGHFFFLLFFRVWFLLSREKTLSCWAVFFGREKFEKTWILDFEITQNKPCKCSRENCFIPVQLKAIHACENEFGARKKKSKICPSRRLRFKRF